MTNKQSETRSRNPEVEEQQIRVNIGDRLLRNEVSHPDASQDPSIDGLRESVLLIIGIELRNIIVRVESSEFEEEMNATKSIPNKYLTTKYFNKLLSRKKVSL